MNPHLPPPLPRLGPLSPDQRWLALDVLRAFALFGILLVNMNDFRSPDFLRQLAEIPLWQGFWNIDLAAYTSVNFLLAGKCITIFTIAFGFGLQKILDSQNKGILATWLTGLRRLAFLGLLGLLHLSLLWFGDILFFYALCGLVVVVFVKTPPQVKLISSAAFFFLTSVFLLLLWLLSLTLEDADTATATFQELINKALLVYSSGSWSEMFFMRLTEAAWGWSLLLVWGPASIALMLLGAWAAQTNWLDHARRRSRFKLCLVLGFSIGMPLSFINSLYAVGIWSSSTSISGDLLWIISSIVGPILMSIGYIGGILLLFDRPFSRPCFNIIASRLAAVGRMSLTNYLMQSLLATFIFYSFGMGLYGQVGAWYGSLLALALFFIQVLFSNMWLSRFRYGPLEWLWRRFTYGRQFHTASSSK